MSPMLCSENHRPRCEQNWELSGVVAAARFRLSPPQEIEVENISACDEVLGVLVLHLMTIFAWHPKAWCTLDF